jgi:hypothetical protein
LLKSPPQPDAPSLLAQRLSEALLRDRIVPRFVDSYVVDHGRYGLQVHPGLYRDLLTLLQREALLAVAARAIELVASGTLPDSGKKPIPMRRKDAAAFRKKYLAALTRQQHWNVGDALEFQSDLQMYEEILARAGSVRRARKPFEVANHPFVDRCAFLLDSSFMEKARMAASRTLADLENLSAQIVQMVMKDSLPSKTPLRR